MESKIYKRQITKQSNALRVLDECQIERYYTKTDIRELYDLVNENKVNNVLPVPEKDRMLSRLLHTHRQLITSYHEHDSLLENRPEEDLSNEEREKAWEEFLRQQKEEGWKVTHDGPTSANGSGTEETSGSMVG